MDTDTFRKMLLNMKESENDLIDLTEAVANLDDASGMVLAMVSMAQELSEQDEVSGACSFPYHFCTTQLTLNHLRLQGFNIGLS